MSDLIRNEDVLCFIEVKTRSTTEFGNPFEAVDKNKENKYYNLSNQFIFANHLENYQIRYDIIEIVGNKINQIKNAF